MEQTSKKNAFGIAAFVISIIGFITGIIVVGIVFDVMAIVLGLIAIADKNRRNGFAIAGFTIGIVSLLATILMFTVFFKNSDTGNSVQTQKQNQEAVKEDKEPTNEFNIGDTAETKNLKITYSKISEYETDNEFMQPKEGNMYLKCEFEFENIGNTDQFVSCWDFECYADDYATEQTYFDDSELNATLSPEKKTKGSVFFDVPKSAKTINLEYKTNFWTQDKIIFIVR